MKTDNTCCCVGVLIGIALIGVLFGLFYVKTPAEESTDLIQIHVVFANGERTPKLSELEMFPLNAYRNDSYYPYGYDMLTNEGRMTLYNLGQKLRNQYDDFITRLYKQDQSFMHTSDSDITKIGALMVLAGLWPVTAEQRWSNLNWQPVPYKNPAIKDDFMLYEINCPRYLQEKEKVTKVFIENMQSMHKDIFERISSITGKNVSAPVDVLKLSELLRSQEHLKLKSPKWYKGMKKSIRDIVRIEYNIMFHNTMLQRLSAGPILQKILNNTIDKIENNNSPIKMHMFSTSLNNIASILTATRIARANRPKYGTAFIVELHYKKISKEYAFKLYVWEKDFAEPKLMKLSKCETMCSVNDFENIFKDILVNDQKQECRINK